MDGPARRISIFLSVFDVHVQRSPATGVSIPCATSPEVPDGGAEQSSLENEQTSVGIERASTG